MYVDIPLNMTAGIDNSDIRSETLLMKEIKMEEKKKRQKVTEMNIKTLRGALGEDRKI